MDQRSTALVDVTGFTTGFDKGRLKDGYHPREFTVLSLVILEICNAHVESIRIPHTTS